MNPITRRLLVAAVRKLLPEAIQHDPGSALALRSDTQLAQPNRTHRFPIDRPAQVIYPPREAPAPPRRRRRIVVVEETTWRS